MRLNVDSRGRPSSDGLVPRGSSGEGLSIRQGILSGALERIVSSGNRGSATVSVEVAALLSTRSRFMGNTRNAILVGGEASTIAVPTLWPALGVPWIVGQPRVDAPFSIAQGSVLRFLPGGNLHVGPEGSLRAAGTPDAPIRFLGRHEQPGYWQGLRFEHGDSVDNVLANVLVAHGGDLTETGGGLVTLAEAERPTSLSLGSVTLNLNEGPGFRLQEGTRLGSFEHVTSTGNARPGVMAPELVKGLGAGLAFAGNAEDALRLDAGDIVSAANWPALDVPYEFGRTILRAPVTIAPGTTLLGLAERRDDRRRTGLGRVRRGGCLCARHRVRRRLRQQCRR